MPANVSTTGDELARWKKVLTDDSREGTLLKPGNAGRKGSGPSSEGDLGSLYTVEELKRPSKTPDGRAGA